MTIQTYEQLYAQVMNLAGHQAFGEALERLTHAQAAFPAEAPTILYLRSCMAARMGQSALAIQIVQEAINQGYWYGEALLRGSPSWQPLQGMAAFEHLVEVCQREEAKVHCGPTTFIEAPEGSILADQPRPLLLALHGNGDNARHALACWRPMVAQGWVLAAVQSSQMGYTDAYGWFDIEQAIGECTEQYRTLCQRQAIGTGHIILAGFSMGGTIALRLALQRQIPARGFILLGPGGPPLDEAPAAWLPLIQAQAARGLRGYILLGERDESIPQAAICQLAEMMNAHGLPCQVEIMPGLGHGYPPDSGPCLTRALAFLQA